MERMRNLRSRISFHDSATRFKELGVDVFLEEARFIGVDCVQAGDDILRFSKAIIATGARAVRPSIEGLAEAGFYTNETIFSLTRRPPRLAVLGGGPLGCEMAQAFNRLGSEVAIFQRPAHLLGREDEDATRIIEDTFRREGIKLILNSGVKRIEIKDSEKVLIYEADGKEDRLAVDEILAGVGRAPNVEHLDLEAAEVQYETSTGVFVNDYLQSTNPKIYAVGDVCLPYKFTHTADATPYRDPQQPFSWPQQAKRLSIPRATYTDPEIAQVVFN